jgi:hypothetical protein
MKKILALSALTLGLFTAANAQQITTNAGTFSKPTAGSQLFEVTFAPNIAGTTDGNVGLFSLPNISNSNPGLTGIKYRKFTSDTRAVRMIANFSLVNSSGSNQESTTNYSAAFGYGVEHHNKGAQRLSTYWGYQGYLGLASVNGNGGKVNTVSAGADVLTGFDYYIVPNVYLGLELSYGLGLVNNSYDGGGSTTNLQLAPGITPFFRLGWRF